MTRRPERPWWASDGPVDGGIDRSEDPVVRHRSARLGNRAGDDDRSGGDDRSGDDDRRGQDAVGAAFDEAAPSVASRRFAGNGQHASAEPENQADAAAPRDQPWWSRSPQDPDPAVVDPEDGTVPVTSHGPGPDVTDAPPDGSGPTGSPTADPSDPDRSGAPTHRPDLCGVCPICTGFRLLEEVRPELAGHLAEAAYHLASALRSLAEHPPSTRGEAGARSEPTTMQHIDVE